MPAIDTSPVPDPPGLVVVGRVRKPDAIVAAVGSWTRLPLPSGADLVRSITDDSVADAVDLSEPVDLAVSVGLTRGGIAPLFAFSVSVKSYEGAKEKLSERHRLVASDNGQLRIEGIGSKKKRSKARPLDETEDDGDETSEDGDGCVLAPAAVGGRIVCGEGAALAALVPYLSRTLPRERWTSDLHLEVRPEPIRAPVETMLPAAARAVAGSQGGAVRAFVDASVLELVDIVGDVRKISIDAQIAESGVVAQSRVDFQARKSLFAQALTTDHGDAPPSAFWHLPADTDTAVFGHGSDPKLFDHPRELLGNLLLEATDSAGMPDAERTLLKELVADRILALFTNGTGIYAKGFDQAAVDKAYARLNAVKPDNRAARDEAERGLVEQAVGWHLVRVDEPLAKVGPILKDSASLWNRPAFAKWVAAKAADDAELRARPGTKAKAKDIPKVRLAPLPLAVVFPKDSIHLEITVPRADLEEFSPPPVAARTSANGDVSSSSANKPPVVKRFPRKPIVAHVFAVPDGATTWLAIGLDAKLAGQKAVASLASAPDTGTLGKAPATEVLREGKVNAGGFATLRGLLVLTALDDRGARSPLSLLAGLPHKGAEPILFASHPEAPSEAAKAGASVGDVHVSRAVIEDVVRFAMSSR